MKIERIVAKDAPKALGAYSHVTVVGNLIFTAGFSGRDLTTNLIPGVELDNAGNRVRYDIELETECCIANLARALHAADSTLEDVVEVTVFLTDMKDFAAYNKVFSRYFENIRPARTTVGVATLPGPIAIEMKAVAVRRDEEK